MSQRRPETLEEALLAVERGFSILHFYCECPHCHAGQIEPWQVEVDDRIRFRLGQYRLGYCDNCGAFRICYTKKQGEDMQEKRRLLYNETMRRDPKEAQRLADEWGWYNPNARKRPHPQADGDTQLKLFGEETA